MSETKTSTSTNPKTVVQKKKYSWFDDVINTDTLKSLPVGGKTLQYILAAIVVVYIIFLFRLIENDSDALDNKYYTYMLAALIPLGFMFIVALSNARSPNLIFFGVVCTICVLLFFTISYFPDVNTFFNQLYLSMFDFDAIPGMSDGSSFLITICLKLLLVFIVIVGLSLFYNLFVNQAYRQEGTLGFVIYLVFFIPCLFDDFIRWGFKEFNTTPNIVLVLFVLEIIFLLLYFFIPSRIANYSLSKGETIIKEPLFLGSEHIVEGSSILNKPTKDFEAIKKDRTSMKHTDAANRNYALSLWLSYNPVNGNPNTTDPIIVFRYGHTKKEDDNNDDDNESLTTEEIAQLKDIPRITYESDDQFSILLHTETVNIRLPAQKWNNLVFNFHNSKVDVFVNGILEHTVDFTNGLPTYDPKYSFVAGSKDHNLHGAICNTTVYLEPLTQTQITQAYNLLKLQNPPVNNLM